MIEPDMTGQISSQSRSTPCLDPPSFGWFGQYLNTTTVNYPIMGLCPSIILVWSIYMERRRCIYHFLDFNASIMTPEKDRPQEGTNQFVLANITSRSSTSDKFQQMEGWVGWLCPKLTNLSPCPQPLPHRRTMPPRQKIQKPRISFPRFAKVAFPTILEGVSQNQYFACRLHQRENQVRPIYLHISSTSRSRQQEIRNIQGVSKKTKFSENQLWQI